MVSRPARRLWSGGVKQRAASIAVRSATDQEEVEREVGARLGNRRGQLSRSQDGAIDVPPPHRIPGGAVAILDIDDARGFEPVAEEGEVSRFECAASRSTENDRALAQDVESRWRCRPSK